MTFYFLGVNKIMESKDTKEKITCGCGAVVIKSNLKAHLTTKKHLASTGQLASVVPTNSKKAPTNSKKKQEVQWQEPDNEDDEEFEDELDDAVDDDDGAFEDEVMDVLEMITQKIDNIINQNLLSKMKDVLERVNSLETSFKQSHNELIAQIRDLSVKVAPVQSIPPLPQRANEKCL